MCNPVAMAAIPAAISFITSAAQQYEAHETAHQQNAVRRTNADNAISAALDDYKQQLPQAEQERAAAGQTATDDAIAAARARATAQASAADSGLSGISVDSLIHGIDSQEARNRDTIGLNQAYAVQQRTAEAKGIAANTQSRINGVQPGYFNPFTAGLAIIGQSATSFAQAGGFTAIFGDADKKQKPARNTAPGG